jgi:hypothetical protein
MGGGDVCWAAASDDGAGWICGRTASGGGADTKLGSKKRKCQPQHAMLQPSTLVVPLSKTTPIHSMQNNKPQKHRIHPDMAL